jgi:SAM-dependent methyltransferase
MSRHTYRDDFYAYINQGSARSAKAVAPVMRSATNISSVLDVGCGQGAWLAEWMSLGVVDVAGVDGAYVTTERLLIPQDKFRPHDLTTRLDLGRTFDLVQSLEVAEHIPSGVAATFVDSLIRHGDVIMFPGQGGEFHINEQPLEYWRALFAKSGYRAFDAIRPSIAGNAAIEPWYRYNIVVYANAAGAARLSAAALAAEVPTHMPIPEVAPVSWRLRNKILAALPRPIVEGLAQAKHSIVRATQK